MAKKGSRPHKAFGDRLHQARRVAGLTQAEFGEMMGVDKRTISQYEVGGMLPRGHRLRKIAQALGVDAEWLSTGQSTVEREHLAHLRNNLTVGGVNARADLIFVEEWADIQAGSSEPKKIYSPNPGPDRQLSDIGLFVPVVKSVMDRYRAVRYPGTYPENPSYPAGSVLIFDESINGFDRAANGDDLIFRIKGNESEVGLRGYTREPGLEMGSLVSVNPVMPLDPIPADQDVEVLGAVVSQVITRKR